MANLTMQTRAGTYEVPVETDKTIVTLAKQHKIVWGHACQRGICAQCRTLVVDGAENLNALTDEEKLRLRKAERAEGYRLGCQIQIVREGNVTVAHRPY
ncbi:2Fe-2S iron-sulfur cluster-binding protein [Brevibacillus sp. TJ4]|uniref:2Fe-2S iron-sulfur cluster-binding protein n=1 Tax=Brevibacillus sp. TJ4 TaxID=3234853 RepID=UPI0037D0DF9A